MLLPMVDPVIQSEELRPISRVEYRQMVDAGILDPRERIELLRGAIVTMSPIGMHHVHVVSWFTEQLILQLDRTYQVRTQAPFVAGDWSEPEPDVAVARKDYTLRDHPRELFLVIEVSDSTLRRDRKIKTSIYAEAGVPEYWIVNLQDMTVEVHTDPAGDRYETVVTLRDGDVLRPKPLPAVAIAVAEIPR
jgi:Uma2 family endonuclease